MATSLGPSGSISLQINPNNSLQNKTISLTERQIAKQTGGRQRAGRSSADLVQEQVWRVLLEANRNPDMVDAEEAAARKR